MIFVLNLPFGIWRARTRKFSLNWFLAIHLPVIAAILLRFVSGIGWQLAVFIHSVVAFFLGQLSGGWIYRRARGS